MVSEGHSTGGAASAGRLVLGHSLREQGKGAARQQGYMDWSRTTGWVRYAGVVLDTLSTRVVVYQVSQAEAELNQTWMAVGGQGVGQAANRQVAVRNLDMG